MGVLERKDTTMLLSTDLFHWASPRFTAEASTLGFKAGEVPPARITLQNPKTGGLCDFARYKTITDEGDVCQWEYAATGYLAKGYPHNIRLTIFND